MGEPITGDHTLKIHEQKRLQFKYRMHLDYELDVSKYFFTMKAIPCSNARQVVTDVSLHLEPPFLYESGTDSFGNRQIFGSSRLAHRSFTYEVCGTVEIGQILFEEKAEPEELYKYQHPHGLNLPGEGLKTYFQSICGGLEENPYVNAIYLMRCLHRDFAYAAGVTGLHTNAEEAWKLGKGVCQDYAHIFIALCHLAAIPARYVVGLIEGEGESHAWVEICYRNKWIGMDPTNDVLVARSHIKFGHGRDAGDCQLNRGLLFGGGRQEQQIKVSVKEEIT